MRRILVTSALPYANGAIHLGHLFEHIRTDIRVRYRRMAGNECIYVCADDAHGTATMLLAERSGTTPEELIEPLRAAHADDFRRFHISHDNYYSTHSPEHEHYAALIYRRLAARGLTFTAEVEQLYDPERGLFLADRHVRGTCPRCGAAPRPRVPALLLRHQAGAQPARRLRPPGGCPAATPAAVTATAAARRRPLDPRPAA